MFDSLVEFNESLILEDDLERNKVFIYFSFDKGFIGKICLETKEILRKDRFMRWSIRQICTSSSRSELICGDEIGYVSIFSVRNQNYGQRIYDFGKLHKSTIYGLEITNDDEYIYTSSWDKKLLKTSLKKYTVEDVWHHPYDQSLFRMVKSNDEKYLFVTDESKKVNQICTKNLS